jgi:hypothetical protein
MRASLCFCWSIFDPGLEDTGDERDGLLQAVVGRELSDGSHKVLEHTRAGPPLTDEMKRGVKTIQVGNVQHHGILRDEGRVDEMLGHDIR